MRIECPSCKTSYPAERCGLNLTFDQSAKATISCVMCKVVFDVEIKAQEEAVMPGRFARTVLRRKPVVPERVVNAVVRK